MERIALRYFFDGNKSVVNHRLVRKYRVVIEQMQPLLDSWCGRNVSGIENADSQMKLVSTTTVRTSALPKKRLSMLVVLIVSVVVRLRNWIRHITE